MDQYLLPLFIVNCLMVLVDASVGYHSAPRLLAGVDDAEAAETGIMVVRRMLSVVVAVYMFFNCYGYFQRRPGYLFTVSGLIVLDMAIQFFMQRRKGDDQPDDDLE